MAPVTPQLLARARAINSELKALAVVCFGYFRYRNARFGCAEVHQAIQAFGRDGMTRTHNIAQDMGMRLVHAMTDCAFIQKPGMTRAEANRFSRAVSRELGVPMELEGVYTWLVLLPSKTHSTTSDVGVPNRYYGRMDDGKLKLRGIEVRRHSTPPWIHDVQQRMLDVLQEAETPDAFWEQLPKALALAKEAAQELLARRVAPDQLAVTTQTRMEVEAYSANTASKHALKRLRDHGVERKPGQYIQYIHTRDSGPSSGKALPLEMLGEKGWFGGAQAAHVRTYLRLLARSVETLFSPFGVTEDGAFEWFLGRRKNVLPATQAHLPKQGPRWEAW